jgi:hypothetical protein
MATIGGNRSSRAVALLLVLVSSGIALSACEYQDDRPAPSSAPTQTSVPAPPPLPKADPGVAKAQARNQTQLDARLGPQPDGLVLAGSGGLGNDGFRTSAAGIPEGSYAITAACVGVVKASLTISQPDRRGGTAHELALDCGTRTSVKVDLQVGPVSAHFTRMTTEPGRAAVAGFWMVPAN